MGARCGGGLIGVGVSDGRVVGGGLVGQDGAISQHRTNMINTTAQYCFKIFLPTYFLLPSSPPSLFVIITCGSRITEKLVKQA